MKERKKNKIPSHSLIQVDEEEEEENIVSSQTIEDGEEKMDKGEEERNEGEEGDVATKLPSIEEFYMKDVKTLNTNMLQGEEVHICSKFKVTFS